ncbi:diaminobutyrate--2-oxoglutarate transaminase [Erwinia phyllosphaerae]|uniref:diaminobutyrate--2-oxoglutarate transaminase n=1 Tax=Erwinia phyllosphaerae TaxID=2853256 RepID=UPI001FEEDCC9|nr:diaminobutyrate--2-oxoglutarate transaminase [Erwinia phyllosphaerae]MBV4367254.1 diaminobutyrate--2-oxoglutarate transaminase [Erwinia phyllosphaerae]
MSLNNVLDINDENFRLSNFSERYESNVRTYSRDFPAVFHRAKGSVLYSDTNKPYLDFFSGAGALNYGHNNPVLKEALINYISKDGISHGLDLFTSAKERFINSFVQYILCPRNLDYKLQFTGPTGTNAVEAAVKIARKYTGRKNVISFTNAFHGMSLGSLSLTANPKKRKGAGVALHDSIFMPYDGYLGPDIDTSLVLKAMLQDGGGLDKPAAIIVETIQGEGGVNTASRSWLRKIYQIAKELDILFIVDDIQAGCGRSGTFFSFEEYQIKPDIVVLSKSLSGYGLPMSLLLLSPEIDIWEPGEHNGTFRGNNHAFITAETAISNFWATKMFSEDLSNKIGFFDNVLDELQREHPEIGLRGRGLFRGISFNEENIAGKVSAEAFNHGLIVETSGVSGHILKLLPALTISQRELQDGISIISDVLKKRGK